MKSCPKCLGPIENYRHACNKLGCAKMGIPVKQEEHTGQEGQSPAPMPDACECGDVMTLRICPDCGFEMEDDEMRRQFFSFSLVGSGGSGKSNYLAVLVNQLRSEMCKVYGCTLYPTGGDRTMDHYKRQYHHPLFEQGVCVSSTQLEDLNPLTYALLFPEAGKDTARSVGLAFYDSCGKELESVRQMSAHSKNIYSPGGILFLIDPSQLPVIKEARRAENMPVLEEDVQSLLLRTIHLIRNGLSMHDMGKKIDIPLAICLTKIDTLYQKLDPASFIAGTSRNLRRPMLNTADISSCSLEVMALLERWGGEEMVRHIREHFSDYCFFGMSALGSMPSIQNEIDRVRPHRVLDPLLWLLWRHKVLKAG